MNDIDAIVDEMDDEPHSPEYEAALRFHEMGFNVVPIRYQTKIPSVAWGQFQTQRISRTQLARWINKFASAVGVITGAISGIVVIDTDGAEGEAVLCDWGAAHGPIPTTLTVRSGSGRGVHRYFQHPGGGQKVKSVSYSSIKLDIKGDGGIVVLPPSLHKSGARYTVEIDAPIAALPVGLIEHIGQRAGKPSRTEPSAAIVAPDDEMTDPGNAARKPPPVNRVNAAIIQTMLDALPDPFATEENLWFRVGLALHYFDRGAVGLALWRTFSLRCPHKAALTDFEKRWTYFNRDYEGKPITLGWLWAQAAAHGWLAPCRWDRSTHDKFEGSRYDQR